jgi:hypothetical protein
MMEFRWVLGMYREEGGQRREGSVEFLQLAIQYVSDRVSKGDVERESDRVRRWREG